VGKLKGDVSSISPLSEPIKELCVVLGLYGEWWSYTIGRNMATYLCLRIIFCHFRQKNAIFRNASFTLTFSVKQPVVKKLRFALWYEDSLSYKLNLQLFIHIVDVVLPQSILSN